MEAFLGQTKQLDADIQQEFNNPNFLASRHWLFTGLLLRNQFQIALEMVTVKMREQLAILGIGIRLYQSEYGILPDHLSDLGKVGINFREWTPIGGKPFGYRREGNCAVLWGTNPKLGDATSDEPLRMPSNRIDVLNFCWELK